MRKVSSAFQKAGTSAAHPYGAMNCIPAFATHFRIAKSYTRWCGIFKVISEEGGWADISNNFRASLFKKGLSN
jgi:hypothetical protein